MENSVENTDALYQGIIVKYRRDLDDTRWQLIRSEVQREALEQEVQTLRAWIADLDEQTAPAVEDI